MKNNQLSRQPYTAVTLRNESTDHRIAGVGKDIRRSSPTTLLKQLIYASPTDSHTGAERTLCVSLSGIVEQIGR